MLTVLKTGNLIFLYTFIELDQHLLVQQLN